MAKRNFSQPTILPKVFSSATEIDTAIAKLRRRIESIKAIDPNQIPFNDQKVKNIETSIRETIRDIFGQDSPEFHDHQYHQIWSGGHVVGMDDSECQHNFASGIPQTMSLLEGLVQHLEERKLDLGTSQPVPVRSTVADNNNIFIVHGRHNESKEAIARFLECLDLKPIVLHEQPNQGKTVIEKFEANAEVGFAVIILTADDVGALAMNGNKEPLKQRSRQNVIFELGYFVGRLTRARVCALYEEGVELPSDIHGIAYVPWDANASWKLSLIKELKAAGYDVDANKAFS